MNSSSVSRSLTVRSATGTLVRTVARCFLKLPIQERYLGLVHGSTAPSSRERQKIVVDTPVDDVHALQALGGAHENAARVHRQVAALHQLDADLLGQVAMLEVRGIADAGR